MEVTVAALTVVRVQQLQKILGPPLARLGVSEVAVNATIAFVSERTIAAGASAAARMLRAYPMQLEALRRWRNGGSQTIRIEHLHINEGARAIVGTVNASAG